MYTSGSFLKPPTREHDGAEVKAANGGRQLREAKEGQKRGVES